ncbi:MAG: hypothetical protein IJ367_00780, partial [Clostridia bacterium]|nr:hypothetical protein [Clostridia bacterium]
YVDKDITELLIDAEEWTPSNGVKELIFGTKPQPLEVKLNANLTPVGNEMRFDIALSNAPETCSVILALYDGQRLVDMEEATYNGENVSFTSSVQFDSAKVMLWETMSDFKPIISATKIQ